MLRIPTTASQLFFRSSYKAEIKEIVHAQFLRYTGGRLRSSIIACSTSSSALPAAIFAAISPVILMILTFRPSFLQWAAIYEATLKVLSHDGIVAPYDKISRSPETVNRFMTASLKGYQFFLLRRDATINRMMQILKRGPLESARIATR